MSEETPEHLPTGLASLDSHIEGGGLRPETVLAIDAPARSVGRRFAFNCCAERPVHYVTLGYDPATARPHVERISGAETITTESIPPDAPLDPLCDHLDAVAGDLPAATTLLVDPITPVERLGDAETAAAIEAVRGALSACGGLGIVLALGDEETGRPGRWVTRSQADALFSLVHEATADGVSHHLAIDRLPLGQQFRAEDGSRTFELPPGGDMTLDTSKTLSP